MDNVRSRSETPQIFTLSDENDLEFPYDLRSRSRSSTPFDTGKRRSKSGSLPPGSVTKKIGLMNQLSMMPIVELNDTIITPLSEPNNGLKTPTTVTKNAKKSERRSERQRLKRESLANGQSTDESSERNRRKSKRMMTSDYSSDEGSISRQNSAYEFYKQQGDYWNKFPKTDYTYSLTSQCRYEIAPGIMAIPNMSRRSLHSDGNSFIGSNSQTSGHSTSKESCEENGTMTSNELRQSQSDLARNNKTVSTLGNSLHDNSISENQINEKYESWATPLLKGRSTTLRYTNSLDSDTELDEAVRLNNKNDQKSYNRSTNLIATCFYALFNLITFGYFKKQESYTHYTSHYYSYKDTKWTKIKRFFQSIRHRIYMLLVHVALLDTWLLSKASNFRDKVQGRRTKILWLVLLPLALTIGCWSVPYIISAIPFPTKQVSYKNQNELSLDHTYSQEQIKTDPELREMVDLLINRVQKLEAAKIEQTKHLTNISQVIEDLKHSDSDLWKNYEEKILHLEHIIEQPNSQNLCKKSDVEALRTELQTLKHLYIQSKRCCDDNLKNTNEADIQQQADKAFAGYFGDSVSKSDVLRVFQIMNSKIHQSDSKETTSSIGGGTNLDTNEIRNIVLGILKIYDADKTGQVDYALESAGGQVISTRCTQLYNMHTRAFKILGLTLYYESNNPRIVIQGNAIIQPGMCWAFQDFPGYLLIKLRSSIYVTGFTIEHAPRTNLPNGEIKSAPKKFNVWGLQSENDIEPVMFGEYEFLDSNENLQYFQVQNTSISMPYEYVELRIHSNHGQLEYTCLYRFRVHGNLA